MLEPESGCVGSQVELAPFDHAAVEIDPQVGRRAVPPSLEHQLPCHTPAATSQVKDALVSMPREGFEDRSAPRSLVGLGSEASDQVTQRGRREWQLRSMPKQIRKPHGAPG